MQIDLLQLFTTFLVSDIGRAATGTVVGGMLLVAALKFASSLARFVLLILGILPRMIRRKIRQQQLQA